MRASLVLPNLTLAMDKEVQVSKELLKHAVGHGTHVAVELESKGDFEGKNSLQ